MSSTLPDRTIAWRAVERRDRSYDDRFVYAVRSTRIFCRPSCSSRRPTRSKVEFFPSAADAQEAGYRPCKRCKPASSELRPIERAVVRATEFITRHADESITLASLAREVGVSAFHLQRAFKHAMGISPREYRDAERRRRLAARLRQGDTVSRATFEAGFGSSSRVYGHAPHALGMTPATVRRGGAGERIQFTIVDSTLGRVLGAYTERGVCSVLIGSDDSALEREFRSQFSEADISRAGPTIHEWIGAIVQRIDGESPQTAIPIDARGTAFQWRVWNALQQIPRGTTLSYGELAKQLGQPSAARAVARACAANPVAIVIPCHRVVRETGEPGGYRWGLERKRELLERERRS